MANPLLDESGIVKFSKMRKKLSIICIFLITFVSAQKMGVVDTNYILDRLPQYQEAKKRMESQVAAWQSDIQKKQEDLQKKKEAFESEKILLVGDQLKRRQKEIDDLDAEIKKLITVRFGSDGEINKMRSTLVNPFQDRIWNAITTVSEKNNLGIVFDKSNNISVMYLDKRYDYTDQVLDLLLKNETKK